MESDHATRDDAPSHGRHGDAFRARSALDRYESYCRQRKLNADQCLHAIASLDESAQTQVYPPAHGNTSAKIRPLMEHGVGVRCLLPLPITVLGADEDNDVPFVLTGAGDRIRVWDVSDVHKPQEVVGAGVDGHWHDVTSIRLWTRREGGGVAPWAVSTGLDGVIRKWRLSGEFGSFVSRSGVLR
jgi:hypothetical protein